MTTFRWPEALRQREYSALFREAFDAGRLTDFSPTVAIPVLARDAGMLGFDERQAAEELSSAFSVGREERDREVYGD
jgi:hypothetical protein